MTLFFVLAAVLTAASVAIVLLPLWRARSAGSDKRREANITIYHQRCAEIEREVATGRTRQHDAEREKDELGARLLADLDDTPTLTGRPTAVRRPWLISVLMGLVLVGGAGAIYWQIGDYDALSASDMPDITTMVDKLKQRVNEAPDDLQTRAMLARAQRVTGDYAGAAKNYAAINAAMPSPRVPILLAEAEATLQANDDLQGRTADLFRQVLTVDASSREALWYLGLAAAERGDNEKAVGYWNRLLKQDLPADFANQVRDRRNELSGDKPGLKSG